MSIAIKFEHPMSNGGKVTFSAPILASRVKDRAVWVQIPERVRKMPFPPFAGRKMVLVKAEAAAAYMPKN